MVNGVELSPKTKGRDLQSATVTTVCAFDIVHWGRPTRTAPPALTHILSPAVSVGSESAAILRRLARGRVALAGKGEKGKRGGGRAVGFGWAVGIGGMAACV